MKLNVSILISLALVPSVFAQTSIDTIIRLDAELATVERRTKLEEALKKLKPPASAASVAGQSLVAAPSMALAAGSPEDSPTLLAIYGYAPELVAEIRWQGAVFTVRKGALLGDWLVEHIRSDALVISKGRQRRALSFSILPTALPDRSADVTPARPSVPVALP